MTHLIIPEERSVTAEDGMKDPIILFTNNQAERDLRMMKLKLRREKGTRSFCRVRGFISMIEEHGRQMFGNVLVTHT